MEELFHALPLAFLDGEWRELTLDEKAILIPIGRHLNAVRTQCCATETLAKEAGIQVVSAKRSIESLVKRGTLERCVQSIAGNELPALRCNLSVGRGISAIFLHHPLVDTGAWAELPASGKSLYITMRRFANSEYNEILAEQDERDYEENIMGECSFEEAYFKREWDSLIGVRQFELCKHAGVSHKNFRRDIKKLLEIGLIEQDAKDWRVNFIPDKDYKSPTLESKLETARRMRREGVSEMDIRRALRKDRPRKRWTRKIAPLPASSPQTIVMPPKSDPEWEPPFAD